MVQAYFVSDIHIDSMESEIARVFLEFLKGLKGGDNITHMFWVGDIFDFWIADHDYFQERYRPLIEEVGRLEQEGVEFHYFEGNHDLHLRKFWESELGLKVHPQVEYFKLGDQVVRVEHGDQVDPEDKGYQFLRWFLRTPVMTFVAHALPGAVVAKIGEKASSKSRDYTTHTKTISQHQAIEKLREHAQQKVRVRPFDLLVSGHVHVRDDYEFKVDDKSVRAVNLGTWLDRPCAFRVTPETQEFIELG